MNARIVKFRRAVYAHFRSHGRQLAWRHATDPYGVLVSEIMLQQTQVPRVVEKYGAFMAAFPTFAALARARLRAVLRVWQGLGYNRRAVYLHRIARMVMREHRGVLPREPAILATLPGIGPNTAASIAAFGFNAPVVFIETNIRSAFIHEFFPGRNKVADASIMPLVAAALDRRNPRRWYNALMDYGAMLKRTRENPSRRSAHHKPQKPFHGSARQLRGRIVARLTAHGGRTAAALAKELGVSNETVAALLAELCRDGLLKRSGQRYRIA